MFLNTSRYAKVPTVQLTLADGTQVSAVELRTVPATAGDRTPIVSNDRLDVMAVRLYGDATRYWHIADANSALDSRRLFVQWLANDQNAQQLTILVPEN
jgi:nucleoid-associated protein YgaU